MCLATLIVLLCIPMFADDTFQVDYAANLNINDAFIDITNSGATVAGGVSQNLCVNVYAFDPQEEEIACCTCTVTPNGLVSMSVKKNLINNPLTPSIPNAVVVKLVASTGACNAASVSFLAHGLNAWMTHIHLLTTTTPSTNWYLPPVTTTTATQEETPFSYDDLSAAELAHITSQCGFIQGDGSSFGICSGCTVGGQ
jgi:hypothetical protein